MLDALPVEVLRDAFGWLHIFELDNCGFVTRRWKDIIDTHGQELPLRHFKTFELVSALAQGVPTYLTMP